MAATDFHINRHPFLFAANHNAEGFAGGLPCPLQQHALYAAAMQHFGATIEEITVTHNHQPILKGYFLQRRFFRFIHVTMAFRGPLWCSDAVTPETKIAALKFLRSHFSNWRWNFLSVMPEMDISANHRKLLRSAGFRRIITGSSTVWLDLSEPENSLRQHLDSNWRNQLKKAEKENLSISLGGAKPKHYNWLLEMEKEQRQSKNYGALPIGFVPAYADVSKRLNTNGQSILSVTAIEKGTKIAGALFLLHGNSATYHIGWAGDRARTLNAQNHVLFSGMLALKQQNIKWLDLGGLDTGPQAGIARFKLGMGTPPTTLVGTYI